MRVTVERRPFADEVVVFAMACKYWSIVGVAMSQALEHIRACESGGCGLPDASSVTTSEDNVSLIASCSQLHLMRPSTLCKTVKGLELVPNIQPSKEATLGALGFSYNLLEGAQSPTHKLGFLGQACRVDLGSS
jgi:hypothetical protein